MLAIFISSKINYVVYYTQLVYLCLKYTTINVFQEANNFPEIPANFNFLGENVRLARKRIKLTTVQVAERAGIDRSTLYQIEKGNPRVSLGAYFNVLRVLGLQDDFLKLAADDQQGRLLQDIQLLGGK